MFANPVTFEPVTDDDDMAALLAAEVAEWDRLAEDEPITGWFPGFPSPSPFTNNRLGGRVVPRVPIRLQTNQTGGMRGQLFGGSEGEQKSPEKIDPRSVRFTQIVEEILNSLIAGGWIYKAGSADWAFAFIPRQVAGVDSFIGEIFLDLTTNKVSYKDNNQVIRPLE